MAKRKLSAKTFLLYLTVALGCLCCGSVMQGALSFGMFVGAAYAANPLLAFVIFLATSLVFGTSAFVQAGVRGAVVLLFVLVFKLAKRKIRKWALLLCLLAANVFYCVYQTQITFQLWDKLLYSACGIAFAFVCIYVFRALFVRGIAYRTALDETICIALFAVAASYGMSQTTLWGLGVVYFVLPFALLFCACVFGDSVTLVCAALFGLGNLLATSAYDCAAFCMFAAVSVIAAMRINRFVAGFCVLVVDVLMSYFLNLHGSFSTLVFVPTACSVVVFFAIPATVFNFLQDCVCQSNDRYIGKSVVKKLGMYTARRLYRLSDIFLSMKNAFLTMSAGAMTEQQAQHSIVKNSSQIVCKNCPEQVKCWRQQLQETEEGMLTLAQCAVKKGKCTILDVPQALSLKCNRVSALIAEVNVQCKAWLDYSDRVQQANSGKKMLGDQLGGISSLLGQLAAECKGKVSYNSDKEKELVERLVFHNVLCCGAVVMQQFGNVAAIVTVSAKDADQQAIEQIATKVIGQNMAVEKVEKTENPTWVNIYLAVRPRYTVSFGVSAAKKEGSQASGDTHSVLRTDNGKCIVVLCDGMGSGEGAEQMSATSIGLVENFYRAGFDNDTVLSCVNNLLVEGGNEVFCAVDMCVLDLANGLADFIKLGAPFGLVKCGGKVEIVCGSSLPLGVLEQMKPSVTKMAFAQGDMAVLFSDGVTDCFDDDNALAQIFAETSCTNPQSVAEAILLKALRQCGNKPKDDMTVVVAKLCQN